MIDERQVLTLGGLPHHLRLVALWVVTTLTLGYSTGLVFVAHTTSLTPRGAEERYRGNQPAEGTADASANPGSPVPASTDTSALVPIGGGSGDPEGEMKFEKSFAEMLNITHTHLLAMVSFLAVAASIFALSSRPSKRLKSILIVEPFIAVITSFSAMWLMRYVDPSFSYLLVASSASLALCFYLMMIFSFLELVRPPASGVT